jgi:hypothetical protein
MSQARYEGHQFKTMLVGDYGEAEAALCRGKATPGYTRQLLMLRGFLTAIAGAGRAKHYVPMDRWVERGGGRMEKNVCPLLRRYVKLSGVKTPAFTTTK